MEPPLGILDPDETQELEGLFLSRPRTDALMPPDRLDQLIADGP